MQVSPRVIAWEVTRRCTLSCLHCRASARDFTSPDELTEEEALQLVDEISSFSKGILILTGGDPLLRKDIFKISAYAQKRGMRPVLATNGALLTREVAENAKSGGVRRISISIDGASEISHDHLRGAEGAYKKAMDAIKSIKDVGIELQINTTVTRHNLKELPSIMNLAETLGAVAHHIFMLVPTGRAKNLLGNEVSKEEYENILTWFYEQKKKVHLELKATCAPSYYRIACEQGENIQGQGRKGCLAGYGFCFISHTGVVQPCGYLEVECGSVRKMKFKDIWENSEVFRDLRNVSKLGGKCGICKYRVLCGGCRARAFEKEGNYMGEEPICLYEPALAGGDCYGL